MDNQSLIDHTMRYSEQYPYVRLNSPDWAEKAALAIAYDLCDRAGIKHEMRTVDKSIRREMIQLHADIIREALHPTVKTATGIEQSK